MQITFQAIYVGQTDDEINFHLPQELFVQFLDWQRNVPFSIPLIVAALSTAMLAVYMWRKKEAPGSKMAAVLMIACAEWIFCYACELSSPSLEGKIFWNRLQFFGVVPVPTLWFIFTVNFTGREHWLNRKTVSFLCIVPLIFLALIFTNDYHHFMWAQPHLENSMAVIILEKEYGPAFWGFVIYTYGLLFATAYMLTQMLLHSSHLYRWQASALLIGTGFPSVGRILMLVGLNPFPYIDLEVFGLVITSLMVSWCIFRLRLLDIVPVVRENIIENMHDGVIVLDAENHVVDVNPAAEQIIGYSVSEAIGWPLDQIWNGWSEEPDLSQNATRSRKEILLAHAGEVRTYDVSISPLSDWRGRLMCRIIVLRDISERKRSEEALRENEQRQSMILDTIPDMVYEMDLAGNILYANRFAREVIGIASEKLEGIRLADLLDLDGMKQAALMTKQILKGDGERFPSTYFLRTLSGRTIPVEACARLLCNMKGKETVLGVARDVTEQYRAENLLRESEEKYRTLFEESKDVLFIATPEGKLLDINPSGTELFGYTSKEEIMQLDVGRNLYANPSDREHFQAEIERQGFVKDYEIVLKRKDGKRITLLVTSTVVRNEEGQIVAYRGILRDITEKKQLEQQLFQAQKMESIGTLAGGIAHDFNNILGGILGYASFMKSKIPSNDTFFNYVDTIEKSAMRASELTAKLLAFARGGKYDIKPLDVNRMIGETLDIIGRTMDKSIEIEVKYDKSLPTIEADSGQVQQLLMNLCLNARDAMPAGGKLIIETSLAVFDEGYAAKFLDARAGLYVAIFMTDTGIGMNEETKQRIFEPFFTTKEKGKGTGLGLSMVYTIAKNHGGFVSVYSEPGIGSTFKVYFPASGKPEAVPDSASEMIKGENELVLVVDDEAVIRSLAKDSLETYGYRVITAENGIEALNVYEKLKDEISLVILDMVMPKMGGHEVFLKMKELNPKVKALLSTGYSQSGKAQEILDSGVMGFIQKPYQMNQLLNKLDSVLNARPSSLHSGKR